MITIGGWKYFGNGDFPEYEQKVIIIWNDGLETKCIWTDGIDWTLEVLPVSWKPLEKESDEE